MDFMRNGSKQNKLLDHRFLTVSPLNHGSFGMVFAGKDTWTGRNVAIKCINKPGVQVDDDDDYLISTDDRSEELAIHSKLPVHDHIVNLIHHFEDANHQYMILELCSNGDLYEAIRLGHGPLETEHVRDFMLQLVDAVQHLHSNGVYHRDIKPENIFLTAARTMKLGDFGLATTETWSTEFAVGSDRYMAPEQFDASVYGYGYSPASADVWAIGIVLLNVLFQRNPFATPTTKDPLFADFANDRQSLFDVFPTMSQDTYNVIRHSLALDPANRSLAAVREALKSVVSFTTRDESLDDFAVDRVDLVPVSTAAREPLRTPSITSPTGGQESYPWSTVLATPQKTARLPTIPDDEPELFPGSVQSEWQYVDTDEASLSSNLDSGLGMSYKSSKSAKSFALKPSNNFVGSLPISFSRAKALSPYGATGFSKSWSDLWDEDNEPDAPEVSPFDMTELGVDISRVSTAKPSTPQLAAVYDDGRGSVTPRQAKCELDRSALSSGTATPVAERSAELVKTKSSSILDKWAALGNFRRAKQVLPAATQHVVATPAKTKYTDALASFSPWSSKKSSPPTPFTPRERTPARSAAKAVPNRARAHSANGKTWERRDHSPKHPVPAMPEPWTLDNNWRDHKPRTLITTTPSRNYDGSSTRAGIYSAYSGKPTKASLDNTLFTDDIGDLEWVGGWKD